jgi:hypothetical protein
VLFPIVGKTLVEVGVVFLGDFLRLFHPDGLVLVQFFEFGGYFFDFLLLLVLLVFLDLDVFALFLLLLILIVGNFLFSGLFNLKGNGE